VARRTLFVPYRPKTILNKGKRADHWFWTRYSAYPYAGCQHGCDFCYCRQRKYCPCDDPADFDHVIRVKENAPFVLRRALRSTPIDLIAIGDYQPAEREFGLSRRMLEVCLELGFPVFVLTRSPLVLRDLDLLAEIQRQSRAAIVFSVISAPGSPNHDLARAMERLAPPVEKRFAAMAQVARAGILTGTCMMPILPGICDVDANLANVVRRTADAGGLFVLTGGLTLADQQREYFFSVLAQTAPDLLPLYRRLYPPERYAPASGAWREIPRRVRELCGKAGIADRMPRPIIPGEARALNKEVVEALVNQAYALEIEGVHEQRVRAYRRAAWAIEGLEQDVGLVCERMGLKGLQSIENVGPEPATEIAELVHARYRGRSATSQAK
jgi:DNA repair photolyase